MNLKEAFRYQNKLQRLMEEAEGILMRERNVVKVEKIIQNFRETLDKRYPIWEDFEKVYVYLLRRCHEANIAKDPEIMQEVVKHLRSMRDNWKEVMKKVATDKSNPAAQARVAGGQRSSVGYAPSAMRKTGT